MGEVEQKPERKELIDEISALLPMMAEIIALELPRLS